jgi:hypothetical protein
MIKLTDNQRAALAMLAGSGPRGATESVMAMHFTVDLLAGLVRQGLASVARHHTGRRTRDDGGQDED